MTGGDFLAVAIPLTIFLVSAVGTFWLAKNRIKTGLRAFAGLWALFTGVMLFALASLGSWDGLVYLAVLIGISAPSGLGGVIGSLIGRGKREKGEDD